MKDKQNKAPDYGVRIEDLPPKSRAIAEALKRDLVAVFNKYSNLPEPLCKCCEIPSKDQGNFVTDDETEIWE